MAKRELVKSGTSPNIANAAKNLLEGKTCQNCSFRDDRASLHSEDVCTKPERNVVLPKENTCKHWHEIWDINLKMTWVPITTKAKKLNITWSMDSDLEMTKAVAEELKEEIDKAVLKEIYDNNRNSKKSSRK